MTFQFEHSHDSITNRTFLCPIKILFMQATTRIQNVMAMAAIIEGSTKKKCTHLSSHENNVRFHMSNGDVYMYVDDTWKLVDRHISTVERIKTFFSKYF